MMDWLYKGPRHHSDDWGMWHSPNSRFTILSVYQIINFSNAMWDMGLASILRDHEAVEELRAHAARNDNPVLCFGVDNNESEPNWSYEYGKNESFADDPAEAILQSLDHNNQTKEQDNE